MINTRYFEVVLLIFKLLFIFLFKVNPGKTKRILVNHTFGKTYRFSQKSTQDILIVLKFYIKILRYRVEPIKVCEGNSIILDASVNSRKIREGYVAFFGGETDGFLALSNLRVFNSWGSKMLYVLLTFPLMLILFLVSLFFNEKARFALLLEHVLVVSNLGYALSRVDRVFYFSIYEIDSNLFAYVLMGMGVEVIKVPTEAPLLFWNRNILASSFVFCSAYQEEEVKEYVSTIEVEKFLFWGPERIHEISASYEKKNVLPKNIVGYYSSASWLRRESGSFEPGSLYDDEQKICKALNRLLEVCNNVELVIYLHPREKKVDVLEKSIGYYQEVFRGGTIRIADTSVRSSLSFDKVNVGVAVGSTLMYERLYCGFKSIFYQDGKSGVPLDGSSLSNVWMKTEEAFIEKVSSSLEMSNAAFFKENKMLNYSPKYREPI